VELGKSKRDLLSVERELKESLLALQGLMSRKPETGFTVTGELSPEHYTLPDKDTLKAYALRLRPDMKAAAVEIDRSLQAVTLAKREAVPNVTLGGFYLRDEQKNEGGILASIPIPIFDRKQAEQRGAVARVAQARIKHSGLERQLDKDLEDAYSSLAFSLNELAIFKKEIISKSLENLDLLHYAYKEGKISFYNLRIAQKDMLEIQFAYLDTMLQTQRWINAVERAVGGRLP
jgi:outer membrane protein, heavy metal efflux system